MALRASTMEQTSNVSTVTLFGSQVSLSGWDHQSHVLNVLHPGTKCLRHCLRFPYAHRFAYLVLRGAYAGLRAPQFFLRHTLTRGPLLNMNTRVQNVAQVWPPIERDIRTFFIQRLASLNCLRCRQPAGFMNRCEGGQNREKDTKRYQKYQKLCQQIQKVHDSSSYTVHASLS